MLKRASFIYVLIIFSALLAIGRIIAMQYFLPKKDIVSPLTFRFEEVDAQRGNILAYDGRFLATSIPFYEIRMDCIVPSDDDFKANIDELAQSLSRFFGDKSVWEYKNELAKARKQNKRYKLIGSRKVDYSELSQIKEFPLFNLGSNRGGLIAVQTNIRKNPFENLAKRSIGYINSLGEGVGIESNFDYYLKGTKGRQKLQKMAGGEWIPIDLDNTIPPSDGLDILTTIDIDIQEIAESALREQLSSSNVFVGATAIVMEVKSGAIRAIANLRKDKNGEFDESYNYAIADATEPGSTMKLATLIALLEDGYLNLSSRIDVTSNTWEYSTHTFRDEHATAFGNISLKEAFERSSNIGFAKSTVQFYTGKDEKRFTDRIQSLKLTEKYNLEIKGEGTSVIYTPGEKHWNKLSLPMLAIGYGITLTPLQILTFYNAVANDGIMMKPYFVESLKRGGTIEKEFGSQELSGSICSKSTIKEVKKALRGVVENGTAKNINDKRYSISGKTGTAQMAFKGVYIDQNGYKKHQASFAGFFPSEKPKFSAIVVLYTDTTKANFYGGTWASPVFKKIADRIYESHPNWDNPLKNPSVQKNELIYTTKGSEEKTKRFANHINLNNYRRFTNYDVQISQESDSLELVSDSTLISEGVIVPDVLNMSLREAFYNLENSGFSVKFSGRGRVISQFPLPGKSVKMGSEIKINLSGVL